MINKAIELNNKKFIYHLNKGFIKYVIKGQILFDIEEYLEAKKALEIAI